MHASSGSDNTKNSNCLDNSSGHSLKSCLTIKTQQDSLKSSTHSVGSTKSVRYDTVEFREYPIILCDNPSTSSGPPIGLGWAFDPKDTIRTEINAYEAYRDGDGETTTQSTKRNKNELRIPPDIREDFLLQLGYSRSEIRSAVELSMKDKKRIQATVKQDQRVEPIRKGIQSIKRGMNRTLSLQSLVGAQKDDSTPPTRMNRTLSLQSLVGAQKDDSTPPTRSNST
jgi:hypothetical protein